MEWHETKKLLIEKRAKGLELKQLSNKIKFGINKLDEYLRYMQKSLNHVNTKARKEDSAKTNALKKCQELRDIIDKKEKETAPQARGNNRNVADMKVEMMSESSFQKTQKASDEKVARDEEKVLKDWAEALAEMVSLIGRRPGRDIS